MAETQEPPAPPVVAENDPRLWNVRELADALGVPREYIVAMKRFGFRMPFGRSTVKMAHQWISENAHLLDGLALDAKPAKL